MTELSNYNKEVACHQEKSDIPNIKLSNPNYSTFEVGFLHKKQGIRPVARVGE